MKELIPVTKQTINETETLSCDSRDLHTFLDVGCEHHEWVRRRVEKYGFTEGIDFIVFLNSEENPGGRPVKHYILSIDMAKQLAMVENNDKGAEVRRYFIECERIAKDAAAGYKTKPRRSQAELNARSAAVSYRMMARMKTYPETMRAVFAAKSVALLTGEPLSVLLPPVLDGRDRWMSPTALGEHFGISANTIGKMLTAAGLHGRDDIEHKHSRPLADKSRYSNKEVTSYTYDPAVVLPVLEKSLRGDPALM